jgi:hypothetical protein
VWVAELRELEQHLVDVSARVLEQFVLRVEHDEGNVAVAQHAELHGLLHQTILALGEGDLAVALVRNADDFDLLPPHLFFELAYCCLREVYYDALSMPVQK